MKNFIKTLKPALICLISLTVLCGVIYPGIVTGAAQIVFPKEANGSIVNVTLKDGTIMAYGSELIAQEFSDAKYLIGRPLGVSNLSPNSKEEKDLVQERIDWFHQLDPDNKADIPADLVTAPGSGVDPHISPEAAEYQVARIAKERGISKEAVRKIIKKCTTGRLFGFWGNPAVNVLKVNLMLDNLL